MAKQEVKGKRIKPTKAKIKTWLKGKGHDRQKVDAEVDAKSERDAILALHGVTLDQWRVGGGK